MDGCFLREYFGWFSKEMRGFVHAPPEYLSAPEDTEAARDFWTQQGYSESEMNTVVRLLALQRNIPEVLAASLVKYGTRHKQRIVRELAKKGGKLEAVCAYGNCNKTFSPKRITAKYCCAAHRHQAYQMRKKQAR